jgi:hypothetical protein
MKGSRSKRVLAVASPGVAAIVSLVVACTGRDRERPVVELEERPALDRHIEQGDIAAGTVSFDQLFAAGDRLFHNVYNGLDGVGAMRTAGGAPLQRFSIGPVGGGQPIAVSAQSCGDCHAVPFAAGAGHAHTRVLPDPDTDGKQPFNARGTTSLHGNGLLQLLAQEMTEELQAARDTAAAEAKQKPGTSVRRALAAKGVEFGHLVATADAAGAVAFDPSGVAGVDPDLVVRPYGWKGFVPVLRGFVLAAANIAMGMQGEEFAWRLPAERQPDADEDGVPRELSVGDVTALTIYNASQETHTAWGTSWSSAWSRGPTPRRSPGSTGGALSSSASAARAATVPRCGSRTRSSRSRRSAAMATTSTASWPRRKRTTTRRGRCASTCSPRPSRRASRATPRAARSSASMAT